MRLVLSAHRLVHEESCSTLAASGLYDGVRRRVYDQGPDGEPIEWVDAEVTPEGLVSAGKYRRCEVCCPEVPEWTHRMRLSHKVPSLLTGADLGREVVGRGVLVSVSHSSTGTRAKYADGASVRYGHDNEALALVRRMG